MFRNLPLCESVKPSNNLREQRGDSWMPQHQKRSRGRPRSNPNLPGNIWQIFQAIRLNEYLQNGKWLSIRATAKLVTKAGGYVSIVAGDVAKINSCCSEKMFPYDRDGPCHPESAQFFAANVIRNEGHLRNLFLKAERVLREEERFGITSLRARWSDITRARLCLPATGTPLYA
jgi:hypothetical protein